MSEPVGKKGCVKLFQPYPWTSKPHKEGYFDALEEYQNIYLAANRDLKKLESAKKGLNFKRIAHWHRYFSEIHSSGEKDYSRGFIMGLSAVRITGVFSTESARNSFYDQCLTDLENGKLKIEDLRNDNKVRERN